MFWPRNLSQNTEQGQGAARRVMILLKFYEYI